MIDIGIDPGVGGAVAAIDPFGHITIIDIPTTIAPGAGMVRSFVDGWALAQALRQLVPPGHVGRCAHEAVHSFPGSRNAPQITFSLGESLGAVKTAIAVCRLTRVEVAPQEWKRFYGLGADKEQARRKAIELLPDAAMMLQRKRDHNRAEALLIAHWLRRVHP